MPLKELSLKNFRCFTQKKITFTAPVVLIEGANGSGKTTLLEAIHYFCYVRSFRTPTPRDLIMFNQDAFFISALFDTDQITIGSSGSKRHVKINQKAITSHKELRALCQIVTVTQEDMDIVKESPEARRNFIDHALMLYNPEAVDLIKAFKYLLDTRNAFLAQQSVYALNQEYLLWTQKLWTVAHALQQARIEFLDTLLRQSFEINVLFFEEKVCSFTYQKKYGAEFCDWKSFYEGSQKLFEREFFYKRTLFGPHLDDIAIIFNDKPARIFSSRGQQKLLSLFLKILQVKALSVQDKGTLHAPLIFLIDDFLSDFDAKTLEKVLKVCISLPVQLILTTPLTAGPELKALHTLGSSPQIISL